MNNDLISRDALKSALKSNCKPEICHDYGTNWCEACCPHNDFEDLIDNAPTVDIKDELAGAYNEGYMCGSREAAKARPQGEWIRTGSLGNGNAHYECSNCHHGDEHAESQEVPYCWFCGAKMKKGGAE